MKTKIRFRRLFSRIRRQISIKKPTILALLVGSMILTGVILSSGFYILNESEAAIVVEYEIGEVIGKLLNRADLIAFVNEQHSGGSYRVVRYGDPAIVTPFGKLYWHLPWPFGKDHKINLEPHNFHLKSALIFELYRDQEGRALMYASLTSDVDGNPLTDDPGFKIISAYDLFAMQFDPEAELAVMMLDVKGSFEITNLEKYAVWLKDSHGTMDKMIEGLGFYGEIVRGPYGDEFLDAYLSRVLPVIYVWGIRFPVLLQSTSETYPRLPPEIVVSIVARNMIENPEIMTDGFIEFLSSPEFIEMTGIDFKKDLGIEFSKKITTEIYEETV